MAVVFDNKPACDSGIDNRPVASDTVAYRPCVGMMLVNPANLVFVGCRIDSTQAAWQMPQGGIDSGETPIEAARRELQEETGITPDKAELISGRNDWLFYDLPQDLVPKLWGGRYAGQMQRWFLLKFHGSDEDICIDTEHPEYSEWRWLPVNELVGNIVPFKQDVYQKVVNGFSGFLFQQSP